MLARAVTHGFVAVAAMTSACDASLISVNNQLMGATDATLCTPAIPLSNRTAYYVSELSPRADWAFDPKVFLNYCKDSTEIITLRQLASRYKTVNVLYIHASVFLDRKRDKAIQPINDYERDMVGKCFDQALSEEVRNQIHLFFVPENKTVGAALQFIDVHSSLNVVGAGSPVKKSDVYSPVLAEWAARGRDGNLPSYLPNDRSFFYEDMTALLGAESVAYVWNGRSTGIVQTPFVSELLYPSNWVGSPVVEATVQTDTKTQLDFIEFSPAGIHSKLRFYSFVNTKNRYLTLRYAVAGTFSETSIYVACMERAENEPRLCPPPPL